MPPGAVYVGRPTKWGNPFPLPSLIRYSDRVKAVGRFADEVLPYLDLEPLRGKDLACFCRLDDMCHADALLEAANA